MTAEEKKIWIGRYRKAKDAEQEIMLEIEALEGEWIFPARQMDGMPRGGSGRDLSDLAAAAEPLWIELKAQLQKRLEIYREIVQAIEASPMSETERAILRYRYILCLQWEEIEEQLHMEKSWLHRQRETAIEKLKIPQWKARRK